MHYESGLRELLPVALRVPDPLLSLRTRLDWYHLQESIYAGRMEDVPELPDNSRIQSAGGSIFIDPLGLTLTFAQGLPTMPASSVA